MKKFIFLLAVLSGVAEGRMAAADPVETEVQRAVDSSRITLVHLWAPWCPNCKAELESGGWAGFLAAHPDVDVIFVTTWSDGLGDGKALLAKYGVGSQKNFRLRLHPNTSRRSDERMKTFLGLPVSWLPATWVFREGKPRYLLNYGEIRFPLLDQLVRDASDAWDR